MWNRKPPIRTYQRKTAKKPFVSSVIPSFTSIKKCNLAENKNHFDENGLCDNSLNYDPFETTFDRIAKETVAPLLPLDSNENQNASWNSSSDSNISNASAIKASEHIVSDFSNNLCNNKSKLTHANVKLTRRRPQEDSSQVVNKIVPERIKVKSVKNELWLIHTVNTQRRKRQIAKTKKKKITQSKKLKKSSKCNEQIFHVNSNAESNLEDTTKCENDGLWDNEHRNISKVGKTMTFQGKGPIGKDISHENVKPCFVKLNNRTVQNWYILNSQKTVEDKRSVTWDLSHTNASLQASNKENISNTYNMNVSQSIAIKYNVSSEHVPIEQCSVMLCDRIVKNCCPSKARTDDFIDVKTNLNISHLPETASHCNNSTELALCDMKKSKRELIRDSFVKVEKLEIDKFVKKSDAIFDEKERYMISSTPISKHAKFLTCSIMISPINIPHSENKCLMTKDTSNIITSDKLSNRKSSLSSLIIKSKSCKFNTADTEEEILQRTRNKRQGLLFPQLPKTVTVIETEATSFGQHSQALAQKHNTKRNRTKSLHLDISAAVNDGSRSLFSDTTYSHNCMIENLTENNMKKEHLTDVCKSVKADMINSFVDLNLEEKQSLNRNSDRMRNLSGYKMLQHVDNDTWIRREDDYKVQGMTKSIKKEISTFDAVSDSKRNFLGKNQDDTIDDSTILTQLQDPVRITAKRVQYLKWRLSTSDIFESLNNESTQSDYKVSHNVASDKASDARLTVNNLEHFTNAENALSNHFESHNSICQYDTDKRLERSVFLKPGKHWIRSLSILNNINDELNLEKLSIGKGKKWRQSVTDILSMQKQGVFQSCLGKNKDDTNLPYNRHDATNISSFDGDKYKACSISNVYSANYGRFSKRISVRVIPNNASIKCEVQDAPFLEAFGMTAKKSSNLQSSHRKKSSIDDNEPIRRHSATARDVVLQKCLQNCYLAFSDCFPDTFLDHCRKIGEGVYGEVFLHEHDDRKSVIKIIPIEGEELVNGERQKKFSEILSEIVIAKELDNLRLNPIYRTSGFVQVKSIKCIIGRYPEKLVKLWNVYDDEKRSDNDCPSMFGENQLYIILELGHGGEDLEAFVFQTAEEAYALFLQIALSLAIAEKALEFEHRDLHWGNILISRTKELYIFYNLDGKEIKVPSNGVKMSIIDFTLSRMLYQDCCIYNDLALDPTLFAAHGEYQFEIYRLMRDKIQNDWQKFEPYTNVLWLHYILDKMITAVRYKRKNLKIHKCAIAQLKEFENTMLNYDSAFDFITNSNSIVL